jgi:AraC-like DNA-binding protein
MKTDGTRQFNIIRQDAGRFDRRFRIGPVCWPHFDLLWVHEGHVRLQIGTQRRRLDLAAPAGVLVFAHTPFQGDAISEFAEASVCHFSTGNNADAPDAGFLLSGQRDAFHVQNLMRLSLSYARRGAAAPVRTRLLAAIVDCFDAAPDERPETDRVTLAWAHARDRLDKIRSLSDVARGVGLSESTFRNLHRRAHSVPAGRHLKDMRLAEAERLLATTGHSIAQVARAVGYAHAESFTNAFGKSRGLPPAAYRRRCKVFA